MYPNIWLYNHQLFKTVPHRVKFVVLVLLNIATTNYAEIHEHRMTRLFSTT